MLTTMILMKRSGAVLDRDLIFLAESGEEADPTGVGINFMVNQHFDEIDAEFANVIPSEAEATLDIRAMPGEDIAEFYDAMKRVIGDPAVTIVPIPATRPEAPPSRIDTDMFRALETVATRMYPGSMVLPSMSTGASDMAQLRAKGIQSYGIGPAVTEEDRLQFGPHSDVERLSEASLYRFVEFAWNAVAEVAIKRSSLAPPSVWSTIGPSWPAVSGSRNGARGRHP